MVFNYDLKQTFYFPYIFLFFTQKPFHEFFYAILELRCRIIAYHRLCLGNIGIGFIDIPRLHRQVFPNGFFLYASLYG